MRAVLKHYGVDLGLTAVLGGTILVLMGLEALVRFFILGVLEVSFSFDNAVVNAAVLATMSRAWQTRFMWIGLPIAVVGMRFLFPVVIVQVTSHMGFGEVVDLAINNPNLYQERLHEAHPQITILASIYLLLIFLSWLFEKRDEYWIESLEVALMKVGKLDMLPIIIAGGVVFATYAIRDSDASMLLYGFGSILMFILVNSFASVFENEDEEEVDELSNTASTIRGTAGVAAATTGATGLAGFGKFMYLEVQDAAFSFDGVAGAFAITSSVALIAAGLGVGAFFVRSMTLHLLRSGVLAQLRYLAHGAFWAIGVLAVCMYATMFVPIPEYITGLIGVTLIALAVWSSVKANKADANDKTTEVETKLDELAVKVDELSADQVS